MGLWRGDTIASVVQRGDEPFSLTNGGTRRQLGCVLFLQGCCRGQLPHTAEQGRSACVRLPVATTGGTCHPLPDISSAAATRTASSPPQPLHLCTVTYLSWECGPTELPGSYYAVLDKSRITRNLTTTTKGPLCELGVVDLAAGTNSWAQSAEGCPQPGVELQVDLLLRCVGAGILRFGGHPRQCSVAACAAVGAWHAAAGQEWVRLACMLQRRSRPPENDSTAAPAPLVQH